MLGGNLELETNLNTGIPISQVEVHNQPSVTIHNWELLDAVTQANTIAFYAKYGLLPAN
jgi:hypothetical protein